MNWIDDARNQPDSSGQYSEQEQFKNNILAALSRGGKRGNGPIQHTCFDYRLQITLEYIDDRWIMEIKLEEADDYYSDSERSFCQFIV